MTDINWFIALGFLILGITIGWLYLNSRKSLQGGSKTRAAGILKRFAALRKFKVLDNVTLEGKDGWGHADHILVGCFGVLFVTVMGEVGSYYGDGEDENWAIVTTGDVRKRVPNPLKAGETCMAALRETLVKHSVYNVPMEQLVVLLPTFNQKRELCIKQSLPVLNVRRLGSRLSTSHFEAENGVDVEKLTAMIQEAAGQ